MQRKDMADWRLDATGLWIDRWRKEVRTWTVPSLTLQGVVRKQPRSGLPNRLNVLEDGYLELGSVREARLHLMDGYYAAADCLRPGPLEPQERGVLSVKS